MGRKILLLVTDLEIGGTPTVVRELAVRLRHDAEIHVACLSRWGPVAEELRAAGVPVTALGAKHRFDFRIVRSLLELIDREQTDTVFSFLIHANALAALANVSRPALRVFQSIQTTQPRPRWHWWLGGICSRAAEAVVVPSASVAAAAEDWSHISAAKIRVIPNAVEISSDLVRAAPPGGVFRVGFLGRLDPIKRIEDLIAAIRLLPSRFTLSVFGTGGERPRLERRVLSDALSDRVVFRGVAQSPWSALAQMDALVLPSDAEGFGLVLIEAMAAGVPVVATDVPGIRDVIRHARTGLLVPRRNPASLAKAIQQIASDSALRQRLIEAAKVDVAQRFAWPTVLAQYRQVLLDQS